jgi:hypothetical protein
MLALTKLQVSNSIHFEVLYTQNKVRRSQNMQTYQVKWCNRCVGRPTSNDTAKCTCCKVVRREEFNLLLRLQTKFVRHCIDCEASIVMYRGP